MLFLKMQQGVPFDQKIVNAVKEAIAKECSRRHVPKYIFETKEIPVRLRHDSTWQPPILTQLQTTVNLKKVELPIKHIVSGRQVKASGTLLNPQSLDFYYRFAKDEELQKASRSKL